jgi:hypothetical protein
MSPSCKMGLIIGAAIVLATAIWVYFRPSQISRALLLSGDLREMMQRTSVPVPASLVRLRGR